MRALSATVALAAAALVSGPVGAAPITETINFNLGGFLDVVGSSPPPIANVTGSFTLRYDPTLRYDNDTADVTVNSFTGFNQVGAAGPYAHTLDSKLGFTYQSGFLEFGGIENDSDLVFSNTNDIVVSFNVTNPSNPVFVPCSTPGYTCGKYTGSSAVEAAGYTLAGSNTAWFYGAPQSTVGAGTGVPEPAGLAVLGAGMAALAFASRRRAS